MTGTFFEQGSEELGCGLPDSALRVVDHELVEELFDFGGSGGCPALYDGPFSDHQDIQKIFEIEKVASTIDFILDVALVKTKLLDKAENIKSQSQKTDFKENMGCFPEKNNIRYQQFSPEKQELINKYYHQNPNDSSLYIPINVKDPKIASRSHSIRSSPRSSPKKSAASPVKNRKNYRVPKRTSTERKISEEKDYRFVRRNTGDVRTEVRKKGKVIELPFRPHVITSIETPSESAKSSVLNHLETHPSLFFVKLDLEAEGELSESKEGQGLIFIKQLTEKRRGRGRGSEAKVQAIESVLEQSY